MRDVARMKRLATLLLLLMACIFVLASRCVDAPWWIRCIRAFSEAAMVGALADWFAVTALFRHPAGIPIPHTAILPRNKERIGKNLGKFIEDNFLSPELIQEKLLSIDLAASGAEWLSRPGNAAAVSEKVVALLPPLIDMLSHDEVRHLLEEGIGERISQLELAPFLGRIGSILVSSNRHELLVDELVNLAGDLLEDGKTRIRTRVGEESPWFIPGFIDQMIFERVMKQARSSIDAMRSDPNHELRATLSRRLVEFLSNLQNSPEFLHIGEMIKFELLQSDGVRSWLLELIESIKARVVADAETPTSSVRMGLGSAIVRFSTLVREHNSLREKLNGWMRRGIVHLLHRHRHQIASFVADTVSRWETGMMVEKFEQEIGRDLQFIRINGTLVGGAVGVGIFLLS